MAVGVVTNTEVEDATPAAMVAHTRRRSDYDPIVGMFHESGVDVLMGGGSAHFLPKSTPGSKRGDDVDYVAKFRDAGYTIATTDKEMREASLKPETRRLLGLFHPGNMDGALDRRFLRKGTAERFPDQPDLVDMVRSALDVLSRHDGGFVLMVESGLIDKYSHPLDWERAVMDTIMLDRAVEVAVEFAARRERHADPRHRRSRARLVDRGDGRRQRAGGCHARQGRRLRKAGFPNYPAANGDGYPDRVDVSKRLAIFFAGFPDYYESSAEGRRTVRPRRPRARPELRGQRQVQGRARSHAQAGNLPRSANQGVHSGDDVILTATGPGSERVVGFLDNTAVFRIMVDALGLGAEASR